MERVPALDGLRGVAIGMVVAYHIDKTVVPAGYWGLVLFFVLSGYLITRLLSAEVDRTGRVDRSSFYLKRGVRVVPALLVLCLALLAAGTDWSRVVPTLGFYANYARIDGLDLGPLTHTWFLAVMAHFYVLWPIVIGAIAPRHRLRVVTLLAAVAVVWRVAAIGIMSPGWVYNATDTNAAALMLGCYLGVARPRRWRFSGWSIPALVGLMFLPVFGEESPAFLWGGFVALALAVPAVQYGTTRPEWLETRSLLWLGKVAYGLYLWHYIFLRLDISAWIALPLSVAAAAASWYLLERPFLRWSTRLSKGAQPRLSPIGTRQKEPLDRSSS